MTGEEPMLEISKRFRFESHHKLPWHNGKCSRDHGHSYILEVSVTGPVKPDSGAPDSGMVLDFYEISTIIKPLIEGYLDHYSLNDLHSNPTAENIVLWLVNTLQRRIPAPAVLTRVRLHETADAWVEWRLR